MGYSIRYAPRRWREKPGWYDWRFQVMTAALLLGVIAALRGWQEGRDILARWLMVGEGDSLVRALEAMSRCIAGGAGWYEGAVIFGRTILAG